MGAANLHKIIKLIIKYVQLITQSTYEYFFCNSLMVIGL